MGYVIKERFSGLEHFGDLGVEKHAYLIVYSIFDDSWKLFLRKAKNCLPSLKVLKWN